MLTLLGSLLGFGSSIFPSILAFFQDKSDKKQELATMEMELQLQDNRTKNNIKEFTVQADSTRDLAQIKSIEQSIIQAHMPMKSTGVKFIDGLRGSVRPLVTFLFVGLYIASKSCVLYYGLDNGSTMLEFATVAFSEDDLAILATILAFWFGDRLVKNARK